MRAIQRIPIIMDFFLNNPIILEKFINTDETEYLFGQWENVEVEWSLHPDYRFGQLLINMSLIPDGRAWFEEEVDWLIENGWFKFEELHWWGVNYYKNGRKRSKTKYVTLDKLDISHIDNIIHHAMVNFYTINPQYLEYFKQRINGKDK